MKNKAGIHISIIYTITVIMGLLTLEAYYYPVISDAWNRYVSSTLITGYVSELQETTTQKEAAEAIAKAQQYNVDLFAESINNISAYTLRLGGISTAGNENISDNSFVDNEIRCPDRYYEQMLSMLDDQMMGYIQIPSIGVQLPIYHYSSETVLSKGIGHLYGSSLPVGGRNTHTVLTGHSGLMRARMFSDLEQLKRGDDFYLTVANQTLHYQVDQIKVVLPDELSDLSIEEEKDLCTLVTCTPYGINTHRLLVRGTRKELTDQTGEADASAMQPTLTGGDRNRAQTAPGKVFALCILTLLSSAMIIVRIWWRFSK